MRYGRSYGVERSVHEGTHEKVRRGRGPTLGRQESGTRYLDEHLYEDTIDQFTGDYSRDYSQSNGHNNNHQSRMQLSIPSFKYKRMSMSPGKFLFWIVIAVEIYVLVSILSVMLTSTKVVDMYDKISGQNTSGNFNKKLAFVSALVNTTGNADYALSIGFTKEEAEQMVRSNAFQTGFTDPVSGDPVAPPADPTVDSYTTGFTKSEWETALNAHNNIYYKNGNGYIIESFNGVDYLTEKQGKGYWGNVSDSGGSNTVDSVGCYLFACTNAINSLNGSTVSIADILPLRNSSDNITWNSSMNKWQEGLNTRTVGNRGYDTEKSVFEAYGLTYTQLSTNVGSGDSLYSLLSQHGFDNCVYIVYGHTNKVSSGGCHWLCCVGIDTDGNFAFLNNGSRGVLINKNEGSDNCGDYNVDYTQVYKVSK